MEGQTKSICFCCRRTNVCLFYMWIGMLPVNCQMLPLLSVSSVKSSRTSVQDLVTRSSQKDATAWKGLYGSNLLCTRGKSYICTTKGPRKAGQWSSQWKTKIRNFKSVPGWNDLRFFRRWDTTSINGVEIQSPRWARWGPSRFIKVCPPIDTWNAKQTHCSTSGWMCLLKTNAISPWAILSPKYHGFPRKNVTMRSKRDCHLLVLGTCVHCLWYWF